MAVQRDVVILRARPGHAAAVAADWYDRVYRPSVHRILRDGLALACRNGTESDRYLYIAHQERRGLLDGGAGGPALGAV